MKDLYDMDLSGRLPLFIKNLLSDRKFRVRVGTYLSDFFVTRKWQFRRVTFYLSPYS